RFERSGLTARTFSQLGFGRFKRPYYFQILLKCLKFAPLPTAAQYPVMSDSYKPFGENMHREPTDKFLIFYCDLFLNPTLTIILVIESGFCSVDIIYPMISDGYLMTIS